MHILTAGTATYTSDQRFQVILPPGSSNWTLQIKYPQVRDSGLYECQINTEPKLSLLYTLHIIGTQHTREINLLRINSIYGGDNYLFITELKAQILGPADLYVKSDSDVHLVCKLPRGPHDLGSIFWYKGSFCCSFFCRNFRLTGQLVFAFHFRQRHHSAGDERQQFRPAKPIQSLSNRQRLELWINFQVSVPLSCI